MGNLERKEMTYWENKYSYGTAVFPPSYRIFERDRFLFKEFRKDLRNKTLIEIGCLFPHEVITILNPSKYEYTYVGIDIAGEALKAARNYLPGGMFVRCSATQLPFRDESFDVLLSLGVIHHLPGGSDNIRQLSRVLRNSGLFVLTEAVERRTLAAFDRLRSDSSSPHEDRLKPQELLHACRDSGKIVHFLKNNSVVLGLFAALIDLFPILQESKTYLRTITAIDQLTIRTVGRNLSLFDGGAYFIIFRKA